MFQAKAKKVLGHKQSPPQYQRLPMNTISQILNPVSEIPQRKSRPKKQPPKLQHECGKTTVLDVFHAPEAVLSPQKSVRKNQPAIPLLAAT